MLDPDQETEEHRRDRLEREAQAGEDVDLKAADLLKYYLRNKVVRSAMYRFCLIKYLYVFCALLFRLIFTNILPSSRAAQDLAQH